MEMFFEDASHSEILSLLVSLKPDSSVMALCPPEIPTMQHQEDQGTQWVLVVGSPEVVVGSRGPQNSCTTMGFLKSEKGPRDIQI